MRTDRYEFMAKLSALAEDAKRYRVFGDDTGWWAAAAEDLNKLIAALESAMYEEAKK